MSLILALFCEIKSASADSSEDLCISQMTVGKALDNPYTKHKDIEKICGNISSQF